MSMTFKEVFTLKKLIADPAKCTGCGTCEEVCSKTYFKSPDKLKSAIRVFKDNNTYRIEVCDQCGDCMAMCSTVALKKADNGVIRLSGGKCTGCLICVAECQKGFMRYHDDEPVPFKCVACGLCAKQCPSGALALGE
jgi:Fe-S-cluster-containing hydrogenase component 2